MTAIEIILGVATIFSANYGTTLLKEYLYNKRRQKNEIKSMDTEYIRSQKVKPILDSIRVKLGASRVAEIHFSNGEVTYGNYHLKKISVITEANADNVENIAGDFQLIPAKKFDRVLESLYNAPEDYQVYQEDTFTDDIATLNKSLGIVTMVLFKLKDESNNWIGYILIGYDHHEEVVNEDLVTTKFQVARLPLIK